MKDKKAFFLGLFSDMLGWFIFFLGMVIWFVVFGLSTSDIVYEINTDSFYLEDKTVLTNILQTPLTEDSNVADGIIEKIYGKKNNLKSDLDRIINNIYGRTNKACWTLWYYKEDEKKNLVSTMCTGSKQVLFDQKAKIPGHLSPIEIRLTIFNQK